MSILDDQNAIEDLIPNALKARLTAENPDGFVAVKTLIGVVCMRGMNEAEYDRYVAMQFDEKTRAIATKVIVRKTAIHPAVEVLDEWFRKKPGIIRTCGAKLVEFSGYEDEPVVKKYESGGSI